MLNRMLAVLLCATAILVFASGIATAQIWSEVPDAGDFPIGTFQDTVGVGNLAAIDGSMIWDPDGDHVDSYSIIVTDPAAFSASTHPDDGGFFLDDGGFEDDSRLYLFRTDGSMVMANDDSPSGSLESLLTDPSTWPDGAAGLINSPGSVVAGQKYIVAVTYFANDVLDGGGVPLATFSPFDGLHGVDPASTGVAGSWENPGDVDLSWDYRIALTGAEYCRVPEPTSLGLFALGVLGLLYGVRTKK